MKPKADPAALDRKQGVLFADKSPKLLDFIDTKNPLVRMADNMEWELLDVYWR